MHNGLTTPLEVIGNPNRKKKNKKVLRQVDYLKPIDLGLKEKKVDYPITILY